LVFADALTAAALEFIIVTLLFRLCLVASLMHIKVLGCEVHPFSIIDLELPRGHTIAAKIATHNLKDVVALTENNLEVELSIFSTAPDTLLLRFDHLIIHLDDTSKTEVSWKLEGELSVALAHWELDTVVVSNVLFRSLAKSLITYSLHVFNISLTVAFSRLLDNLFFELVDHSHDSGLIVPEEGLDENRRLFKWLWALESTFSLVVDTLVAEAANTKDLIRTVIAVNPSIAFRLLVDAHTTGTSKLVWFTSGVGNVSTSLTSVDSVLWLEAANSWVFIRSI